MINKLKFSQLPNYYNFKRGKINGVYGCFYWLCDKINPADFAQYKNVKFFISRKQYAPELKTNVLFLGDKCFKTEG